MPQSQSNINVLDDAKAKAQKLEYDPNGRLLVETIPNVYIFQKKNAPSTLTMNIISGVFSISYNVEANLSILTGTPCA
jgi:YD repeat-containing protein